MMHILDVVREDHYEIWVTVTTEGVVSHDEPVNLYLGQRHVQQWQRTLEDMQRIAKTEQDYLYKRDTMYPYHRVQREYECYVVAVTTTKRRAVQ